MIKLSVIVPVYHVERYLHRCLDSLLRQGLEAGEYEIICVNDGSPDNCAAILAVYETQYPDIFKVITQENQGLGAARNTGMRVAQGDWIGFVDSDDYVIDNAFYYLCKHFLEKEPDVLEFDYVNVEETQRDMKQEEPPAGEVIFEGYGAEAYNQNLQSVQSVVWTKFYRRAFLIEHDIWYDNVLTEDTIFNFQVFRRNPYVVLTNCSIYRYVARRESIMRTIEREKVCKLMDGQLYGLRIMNSYLHEEDALLRKGVERFINTSVNLVYRESFNIRFHIQEWKHYMGQIREMRVNRFLCKYEKGTMGKMIAGLKVMSSHSYLMYLVVEFLYRTVFEKYILPKLK